MGLIEMQDSETGLVATIDSSDPVTRLKYKNTYAKADAEFCKEIQKEELTGLISLQRKTSPKSYIPFLK